MDAKLRELERQAQDDHEAALRLIRQLQRLTSNQWQAVPCDAQPSATHHRDCRDCGGQHFLRICVTQLNEYTPWHDRVREEVSKSSLHDEILALHRGRLLGQEHGLGRVGYGRFGPSPLPNDLSSPF